MLRLTLAAGFAALGCATLLTSSQSVTAAHVDETALVTTSGAAKVSLQPADRILPKLAQQQELAQQQDPSAANAPQISAAERDLIMKLEKAGYTEIREIKSTAEGIAVKAKKDGREVSLVSDSSGNVRER
jgi:hypothetical protein